MTTLSVAMDSALFPSILLQFFRDLYRFTKCSNEQRGFMFRTRKSTLIKKLLSLQESSAKNTYDPTSQVRFYATCLRSMSFNTCIAIRSFAEASCSSGIKTCKWIVKTLLQISSSNDFGHASWKPCRNFEVSRKFVFRNSMPISV